MVSAAGALWELDPIGPAGRLKELPSMLRLAHKILVRLRPYRWICALAVVQVLIMGALELLKPWPLKLVVDHVLTGLPVSWPWLSRLEPRALLLVGCAALVLVYALIGAFSVTRISSTA
jgi:ATP-binding cassette subfamily B protein/subfamily B ATP-binding cassette protein MsbA